MRKETQKGFEKVETKFISLEEELTVLKKREDLVATEVFDLRTRVSGLASFVDVLQAQIKELMKTTKPKAVAKKRTTAKKKPGRPKKKVAVAAK